MAIRQSLADPFLNFQMTNPSYKYINRLFGQSYSPRVNCTARSVHIFHNNVASFNIPKVYYFLRYRALLNRKKL